MIAPAESRPPCHPFWICCVVFAALAIDGGLRLARGLEQRTQIDRMRSTQTAAAGRLAGALAQLPQLESKLQALSMDLFELGRTNPVAAQIVREFNMVWTPKANNAPTPAATNSPAEKSPAP